jgi:hypothetical protein
MIRPLLVVCTLLLPAIAAAQTPADWHMQVSALDPGDRINVRTIDGPTVRGRVVGVDAESITLKRQGREIRLAASTVRAVERQDRIWNGGGIGFASGFAMGVVIMSTCEPGLFCEHSAEAILTCGALTGGVGFGVGLLMDALVRGDNTVFRRTDLGRFTVAPAVTPTMKSVAVQLRF